MMEEKMIREIPKEKFSFVQREDRIHDERLQTKAVGYLGDAWNRFRRNRSAVVAFILIVGANAVSRKTLHRSIW